MSDMDEVPGFKALMVLDLQNDFLADDGKCKVVSRDFLRPLKLLVEGMRREGGDVIWVRSEYSVSRPVQNERLILNPEDPYYVPESLEEEGSFLQADGSGKKHEDGQENGQAEASKANDIGSDAFLSFPEPKCCIRGSKGAEFYSDLDPDLRKPTDRVIVKTHYSAFEGNSLIHELRGRGICNLYVCGAISNVSVIATVAGAVGHGLHVFLSSDALGYRNEITHNRALNCMTSEYCAQSNTVRFLLKIWEVRRQNRQFTPPSAANFPIRGSRFSAPPIDMAKLQDIVMKAKGSKGGAVGAVSSSSSATQEPNPSNPSPPPAPAPAAATPVPQNCSPSTKKQSLTENALDSQTTSTNLTQNPSKPTTSKSKKKKRKGNAGADRGDGPAANGDSTKKVENAHVAKEDVEAAKAKSNGDGKKADTGDQTERCNKKDVLIVVDQGPIVADEAIIDVPHTVCKISSGTSIIQKYENDLVEAESSTEENENDSAALASFAKGWELLKLRQRRRDMPDEMGTDTSKPPPTNTKPSVESAEVQSAISSRPRTNTTTTDGITVYADSSPIEASEAEDETPQPPPPPRPRRAGLPGRPQNTKPTKLVERKRKPYESAAPVMGEGDEIGEGDSWLVNDLLPLESFPNVFEKVKAEVQWKKMFHRGGEVPRLVAVEADVGADCSFPLYRHPSDEPPSVMPFSPTVARIREYVQKAIGHPVNHALIQLYRGGDDYITEHSDKSLDIVRGTTIVNVSLGAQRVMSLRTKRDHSVVQNDDNRSERSSSTAAGNARPSQRIPLPHNSLFALGPKTNEKWLHAIRPDKRPASLKSASELLHGQERISLTFRHIGTFLVPHFPKGPADPGNDGTYLIWGQGATMKMRGQAKPVISGNSDEGEAMIAAFGAENQLSTFDWHAHYGKGFDVYHFRNPDPPPIARLAFYPKENPHARILKTLFRAQKISVEAYVRPGMSAELTFTDVRCIPPAIISADSAGPIIQYLAKYCFPLFPSSPRTLATALDIMHTALTRIGEIPLARMAVVHAGFIEKVDALDKKVREWDVEEGEIGVVECVVWGLVEELNREGFMVEEEGWGELLRVWTSVGEELGVGEST